MQAVPFGRYPVSAVPFGRYPVSAVPFGRYLLGGIESWRYSFDGIVSWHFLAVSSVGGIFLTEAVKPKCGGVFSAVMQYGGNVLAVGGFSFFGGNDFGGRRYYQNMAVNHHITGTAHQGGNFTAGKIPTTTLQICNLTNE